MSGGVSRGSVAARFGIHALASVFGSDEWQARVTHRVEFRAPRGWQWSTKLTECARHLGGPREQSIEGCFTNIGFAQCRRELEWARGLVRRAESAEWCYRLALFDERVL